MPLSLLPVVLDKLVNNRKIQLFTKWQLSLGSTIFLDALGKITSQLVDWSRFLNMERSNHGNNDFDYFYIML